MGMMHAGKIDKSKPMQRVLGFLRECAQRGATTAQIHAEAHVENPATWISALRQNGFTVACKFEGRTAAGAKVYRYRLVESEAAKP